MAADAQGKVTALRCRIIADLGGYLQLFTAAVPTFSGLMIRCPYDITNLAAEIRGVFSPKTPTGPARSAAPPEATYYIQRLV